MEALSASHLILISAFIIGYLGIIFEFQIKMNKTAVSLFMAVILWVIFFLGDPSAMKEHMHILSGQLGEISQILFFLLGAMTLVELIDSHKGFDTVVHYLHTQSLRKMLWMITIISFVLSGILDNLTTTILMVSLIKKLIPVPSQRLNLSVMVIIAANAGGAWTPIGDVTTTMLWIGGQISTVAVMKEIFLPSVICMLIPLILFTFTTRGLCTTPKADIRTKELEPGANLIFYMGVSAFIFVPVFKWLTGMPPYMGMLIAVSILWFVTDILHHKHEQRMHLRIPHILTKIDVSCILFFLGILLSVGALEATGILKEGAQWLDMHIGNLPAIATIIGLGSAIVDNVPLVAATMGMYSVETYPINSAFWMMIAYAAGTGGSILLIGSSAGVALMGMEKITFGGYMKKASIPALLGFFGGFGVYLLLNA